MKETKRHCLGCGASIPATTHNKTGYYLHCSARAVARRRREAKK